MTPYLLRLKIACALAGAMLIGLTVSFAQDFTGKNINSIQVRYDGPKTVDESRIRNLMSVKSGQKFSAEKLDDDIRSLVESGLVDDVKFSADESGNGITLYVDVTTRPRIAGVGFDGETRFSKKKLAKETELTPGTLLSDTVIFEARQKIEAYYQGYGYPDVSIEYRLQPTNRKGYDDLIFVIDEGEKEQIRRIVFKGNEAFSSRELRSKIKTKKKDLLSFFTKSGKIDFDKLAEDEERILDYYRDHGYLRVSTSGFKREVDAKGRLILVMDIHEGIRYQINKVSFSGNMKVFKPADLATVLTLHAPEDFSSTKMREDIRTMRSYYGSRGYADARIDPDIRDAGPGKVNIIYRVSEGKPYKVGRVTIEGNNKTQDRVIRREVPLKPGDNFNTVDVETTRKRLQGLNYFSEVVAEGSPSSREGYRDLNIIVQEKSTGQLSFGLGFSSIDNVVGFVNVEETNFDVTNPWNFRGGGQRFGLSARLGTSTQSFRISLTDPWFRGRRLAVGAELFYQGAQNLSTQYEQRNVGGAVFVRKPLGKRSYLRGELRYEHINVDIENTVPANSQFQSFGGDFIRPALGLNYVYDSRDALQTPREGHKIDLGLTLVPEFLGGDVDTVIFQANSSKYWNLWWDSILEVAGTLHMVETSGGETPIFDRRFLGGARNLRGFEYRDVGPRDTVTNDVIGGDSSGYATVEFSFPLVSKIRGAVFYDAGFVNEDSWDLSVSDYYSDVGIGLRMHLPFGPIALDYGIPLETPDQRADQGAQFNFYIDYEF